MTRDQVAQRRTEWRETGARERLGTYVQTVPPCRVVFNEKPKDSWHKSLEENQSREEYLVAMTTETKKGHERDAERKEELMRSHEDVGEKLAHRGQSAARRPTRQKMQPARPIGPFKRIS